MASIEVLSAVHGIAPRSDALHRHGTDLERGRSFQSDYDEDVEAETQAWLKLQADSGISIQENGKLHWADHFRPIVEATIGFAPGIYDAPLVRWFTDNRFYRQPTVAGELTFRPYLFERKYQPLGTAISLLAPGSFAEFSAAADGIDDQEKAGLVEGLYEQLFDYFETTGVKRVQLEEYTQSQESFLLGPAANCDKARKLAVKHPSIQVSYLSYDDEHVVPLNWPANFNLAFKNSSLRFARNIHPYYPDVSGRELWQPVVDGRNSAVDDVHVTDWPLEALRYRTPARLVLTHSFDLELLPLPVAQDKVRRLGELAYELQNYLEVEL